MLTTNQKIAYLKQHNIEVIKFDEKTVTVNNCYTKDGNLFIEEITIPNTIDEIRKFLNY